MNGTQWPHSRQSAPSRIQLEVNRRSETVPVSCVAIAMMVGAEATA